MRLNGTDDGSRRCILVEMMDYADTITAERARRVICGYGEGKNAIEGIDSGFSYYELGPALFRSDGSLDSGVTREQLNRYVWGYRVPRTLRRPHRRAPLTCSASIPRQSTTSPGSPTRRPCSPSTFCASCRSRGSPTVIYADRCTIAPERLEAMGIVFKQVPRQIARI